MTELVEEQVVADVARMQVEHVAPQELPLFRATSEAYFREGAPEPSRKDEMLGFGIELGVVFLTPVVLAVTQQAVDYLSGELAESLGTRSSGVIGKHLKRLFGKPVPTEEEATPSLTPEQVKQVRALALQKGLQLNLSEAQAGLLADSLAGSLAVSSG